MALEFHPQTESALLGLPAEIRNRIYEYALYEPLRKQVHLDTYYSKLPKIPGLLQTCRQIRHEASDVQVFVLVSTHHMKLLRKAPQAQLDAYTNVIFFTEQLNYLRTLTVLERLTRLRSIELVVHRYQYSISEHGIGVRKAVRVVGKLPRLEHFEFVDDYWRPQSKVTRLELPGEVQAILDSRLAKKREGRLRLTSIE